MKLKLNSKKTAVLMLVCIIIVICFLLAYYKKQKALDNNAIYMSRALFKLGNESFEDKAYGLAEAYFTKSLKWADRIIFWDQKKEHVLKIQNNLNLPELAKFAQGFAILDGEWVLKDKIVEINKKHQDLERSARDSLNKSIIFQREKNYQEVSDNIYSVMRIICHNRWLSNKIKLEDVYKISSRLPDKVNTPLHMAAKDNESVLLSEIISNGADIYALDQEGKSPFFYALQNESLDAVKILLERGVNPNNAAMSKAPISFAIEKKNTTLLKLLIDNGAHVNKIIDSTYPVMLATITSEPSILSELLTRGASPNVSDGFGITPIIYAFLNEDVSCVKILLKNGANINNLKNFDARNIPYHILQKTKLFNQASKNALEIKSQLTKIIQNSEQSNKTGLTIMTESEVERLQELSKIAERTLFSKGTEYSIEERLRSAGTALAVSSYKMTNSDPQYFSMLDKLTVLSREFNYRAISVSAGSGYSIFLISPQGKKISCDRLSFCSPFIFQEYNYHIMKAFPQLPGLLEIITIEALNQLINNAKPTI